MKLYKVISKDFKAKDGGEFDYTDYLPTEKKKGKWLPRINDVEECRRGYHVTQFWNMFLDTEQDAIFEVETKGLKENNRVGVISKYVCEQIRLVKRVHVVFDGHSNTGESNTGHSNTGDSNTGNWNTGHRNTGHRNTGHSNTGHSNTGESNTGHSNTGDRNTGDWNTGNWNTGDWNTGNWNTGNWNTGDRNTGDWNTGNWNTGDWNTGNWNTGNWNTGFFNTITPQKILLFNQWCEKEEWENAEKPYFIYFYFENDDYKASFQKAFENADKEDAERLLRLPNFNYSVFEEISGITKEMIDRKIREGGGE